MRNTNKPRPVKIELQGSTYMVLYTDRKYRQHRSPAQFYAPDTTLAEVEQWIQDRPDKYTLQSD